MVTEHCIPVDAGAVQLVVESRQLTTRYSPTPIKCSRSGIAFDDFGATLHVCGTADGLEHLRSPTASTNEPHYHYIDQAGLARMSSVRIDQLAVGDPMTSRRLCGAPPPRHAAQLWVARLADEIAGQLDPGEGRGHEGAPDGESARASGERSPSR